MSRPTTKADLIEAATTHFDLLWEVINLMPERALKTEFNFSNDSKKIEAHWQRDKNLRDVLIHLWEWHQLLLNWVDANMTGIKSPFLPAPYNWKTYADMNKEIRQRHQNTQLNDAMQRLKKSHDQALALIQSFSNEQLFTKKHFDWTGSTSLASYCISALSSHYDWAIKKLRAHTKRF
ncbi:ClbS/DfsB family four-helix bundle protein [Colwellia sp. KU-HH00111]|uniref:ClbS/DfsB family four-helix bundle protein n=1 Tax=Colwellia sp. KU-HH00111 TaxID=3127652 RepID=UPI00310B89A2